MATSRHPGQAAVATVAALILAAAGTAGCGKSGATAGAAPTHSATRADPPPSVPSAQAGSPGSVGSPSAGATSTTSAPAGNRPHPRVPPAHPVPAAFRPAPGAPSDAEVRSELAQMAAIQRHEHQLALSAAAANLAGLLPWSLEPKSGIQVSVASVFTDYGLGLACGGLLGRSQLGVAHKTAPCGTLITFTYAGRSLTVPVIDRGPYIAGREWDLTGATAAALGFPGLGRIQWSLAG